MNEFNIPLMTAVRERVGTRSFNQGNWRTQVLLNDVQGQPYNHPINLEEFEETDWSSLPRENMIERCTTQMCTAGWAAELDDRVQWVINDHQAALMAVKSDEEPFEFAWGASTVVVSDPQLLELIGKDEGLIETLPDGSVAPTYHVDHVAQRLLGLSEGQANYLFSGDLSNDEVRAFLDLAIAGAEIPNDDVDVRRFVRKYVPDADDVNV